MTAKGEKDEWLAYLENQRLDRLIDYKQRGSALSNVSTEILDHGGSVSSGAGRKISVHPGSTIALERTSMPNFSYEVVSHLSR
jgi:hypothetical protein